jgi:hypothetical protein
MLLKPLKQAIRLLMTKGRKVLEISNGDKKQ